MHRLALLASVVLVVGFESLASGQQAADPNFDPKVARPAYTETHPRVLFDEAHANFHTMTGRYKPFADLIASDGLKVSPNQGPFSKPTLQGNDVLIIANATAATRGNSAFSDVEADAVRDWVKDGGSLLLITDHDPFGVASESLASRFGIEMSKGMTSDPAHYERKGNQAWVVYTRDDKLLGDHPITRGRDDSERIKRVITFAGQSLKGPNGSVAFLKLADSAFDQIPPENRRVSAAGRAQGLALSFGKGRVVAMGEAGLLSAQLTGANREPMGMNFPGTDNRQLALNIMHWLASPKPGDEPKPEIEPKQVTLENLITADPLPEGYAVVRQDLKDKAGKASGDLLVVSKEGTISKVIITIDRAAKVATRPGKVAATKGYINGTAQSFAGTGMKIVKKNLPDIAKADLDDRYLVDLTLEKSGGGAVMVQIQVFFAKVGYALQVIADDQGDFEKLTKWAKSVKEVP